MLYSLSLSESQRAEATEEDGGSAWWDVDLTPPPQAELPL